MVSIIIPNYPLEQDMYKSSSASESMVESRPESLAELEPRKPTRTRIVVQLSLVRCTMTVIASLDCDHQRPSLPLHVMRWLLQTPLPVPPACQNKERRRREPSGSHYSALIWPACSRNSPFRLARVNLLLWAWRSVYLLPQAPIYCKLSEV
jgi:hypothetical protein